MNHDSYKLIVFCMLFMLPLQAQMIADITSNVETEFGTYYPYLVDVTPSLAPYIIEPDFSNVVNYDNFIFSETEQTLLHQNAFVIRFQPNQQIGTGYKQIYNIYYECRDNGIPSFVTTDAVLHAFHILYDYTLRIIEMELFIPDLDNLTIELTVLAHEHYDTISDSALLPSALKNLAYTSVAAFLLDSTYTIPTVVQDLVHAELDLIGAHAGPTPSPIFGSEEDYSQYVSRGHYTRNADFQRFFRAMMWYGRMTFFLVNNNLSEETIKEATRQALLLVHALHNITIDEESALTVWDRIYSPTVFFVGKADDLTIYDYTYLMAQVYGSDFAQQPLSIFANDSLLTQFRTLAESLPWPEINAWTGKGFRLMGQRYIPDSYMLGQLVYPYVPGRFMPKGLDVMTILGSERAWQILGDYYGETSNTSYAAMIDSLKIQFASLPAETWAQNLYWNWLYSLMPLLFPKGAGYPTFMQNQAWTDKELFTALGSWGELRHDTILYAKQSGGMTGVPPPAPFAPGYVEPNPFLYARLAALTAFIAEGLENRGLLFDEFDWRYERLEELLLYCKSISEKELTGQPLSNSDWVEIINIGETLDNLTWFPPALGIESEADEDMAIIADVHTFYGSPPTVLEEGVGYPLNIYVITQTDDQLYITRGGIFSYYEFTWPADNRLTDESWQTMQTGDNPQSLPVWVESFFDSLQNISNTDPQHFAPFYSSYLDIYNGNPIPQKYRLFQNYPNPFNPVTAIRFELPEPAHVRLVVFDLLGREVAALADGFHPSGFYNKTWETSHVASGVYIYQLLARPMESVNKNIGTGGQQLTKKLVVLK